MRPIRFSLPKDLTRREVGDFLRFMVMRLGQSRLQQVAGNLTFVTLLSLVPLLTIALALFTQFPMFGTFRDTLEAYFAQAMLPKHISATILGYLTRFASKAGRLSLLGFLGLCVSAVAMINMIDRSFSQIWRIRKHRPLLKRIALYTLVALLGPFVMGVSLTLTLDLYTAGGGTLKNPGFFDRAFFILLSILWSTGAFTVLYVVIPNRTIHWREAAFGGLFAAIAFEIVKRLFGVVLVHIPTYRTIYGALAAIPIFLLWIYLSWLIILGGAALTAAVHYLRYQRWRNRRTIGGAFLDAVALLRLLHRARESGAFGVGEAEMRRITGFGLDEIEHLLLPMKAAGWVERIRHDAIERIREREIRAHAADYWRLLADPGQLRLVDVYHLFAFDPSDGSPLAKRVGSALDQALGESLAAYFARDGENASPSPQPSPAGGEGGEGAS